MSKIGAIVEKLPFVDHNFTNVCPWVFHLNFAQEHPYASVQACHSLSAPVMRIPQKSGKKNMKREINSEEMVVQGRKIRMYYDENGFFTGDLTEMLLELHG